MIDSFEAVDSPESIKARGIQAVGGQAAFVSPHVLEVTRDAVVIGVETAGLAAAHRLQRRGLSVSVLEATRLSAPGPARTTA